MDLALALKINALCASYEVHRCAVRNSSATFVILLPAPWQIGHIPLNRPCIRALLCIRSTVPLHSEAYPRYHDLGSEVRPMITASLPILLSLAVSSASAETPVNLSAYRADSGIEVLAKPNQLSLSWPMTGTESGKLVLDLRPGVPLIESVAIRAAANGESRSLLEKVDPVTFVSIGSRESPPDRPKTMSVFNVFFDSPAKRPYENRPCPARAERREGHEPPRTGDHCDRRPHRGAVRGCDGDNRLCGHAARPYRGRDVNPSGEPCLSL